MIRLFRSIAAVIIGYATIVVGAVIFQDLLFGGLSYLDSPWLHLVVGGGLTGLSAVVGGYLLAVIAPFRPMFHTIPLVLWLSFETTFLYITEVTAGPLWFDIVSGGSLVVGVLIGAYAFLRLGPITFRNSEAKPSTSWFGFGYPVDEKDN